MSEESPYIPPEAVQPPEGGTEHNWNVLAGKIRKEGIGLFYGASPRGIRPQNGKFGLYDRDGFVFGNNVSPDSPELIELKKVFRQPPVDLNEIRLGLREKADFDVLIKAPITTTTQMRTPELNWRGKVKDWHEQEVPLQLDGIPMQGEWTSYAAYFQARNGVDDRPGKDCGIKFAIPSILSEKLLVALAKSDYQNLDGLCATLFPDFLTTNPHGTDKMILQRAPLGVIVASLDGHGKLLEKVIHPSTS
jgi:hypothetical protein